METRLRNKSQEKNELEEMLSQAVEDNQKFESENLNLEQQISTLQKRLLENNINTNDESPPKIDREDTMAEENSALRAEIAMIKKSLDLCVKDNQELESSKLKGAELEGRIEVLQNQLEDVETKYKAATNSNCDIQEQLKRSQIAQDDLIAENERFRELMEESEIEKIENTSKMEKSKEIIDALEGQVQNLHDMNVKLKAELRSNKSEIAELKFSLQSTSESAEKFKEFSSEEVATLTRKNDDLHTELSSLKEHLNTSITECASYQAKIEDLELTNDKLNSKIKNFETKLSNSDNDSNNLKNQLADQEFFVNTLTTTNTELNERLRVIKEDFENVKNSLKKEQKKGNDMKTEINEFAITKEKDNRIIDELQKDMSLLKSEKSDFENKLQQEIENWVIS